MDKRWRIKKVASGYGEHFILQKRFLGFLWWYNPDNIDGVITGVYDTLTEAEDHYRKKTTPVKVEIISLAACNTLRNKDKEGE